MKRAQEVNCSESIVRAELDVQQRRLKNERFQLRAEIEAKAFAVHKHLRLLQQPTTRRVHSNIRLAAVNVTTHRAGRTI